MRSSLRFSTREEAKPQAIQKPELWWKGLEMLSSLRSAVLALLALIALPTSAYGDYIIKPGDVLAVDIVGMTGMRQRMPVDPSGRIRVPLVGPMTAKGKTLDEINSIVQQRLSSTTLRQMSGSGEEYLMVLDPRQITVTIDEYRPVYLTGVVSRPGEQPFRPGLTVQQAIALAGGYRQPEATTSVPLLDSFDLRAEYVNLWTEAMRERMRVARLRKELGDTEKGSELKVDHGPLSAAIVRDLDKLESERVDVKRADHTKEIDYIRKEIESSIVRLATAQEQQAKEREGMAADSAELDRLQELEKRGNTTSSRVTDARRALLLSATRYLQATAQISQFTHEQAELRRRLEKAQDDRKLEIITELQAATVAAATTSERIKAAAEKLRHIGLSPASLMPGAQQERSIAVIRDDGNGPSMIAADESTRLQPGDVVEVELDADRLEASMVVGN